MTTFRVKRTGLVLTSMLIDARNSRAALEKASRNFERADKRNLRLLIDDDGDARSEARYELNEGDVDRQRLEVVRWALEGPVSDGEATP